MMPYPMHPLNAGRDISRNVSRRSRRRIAEFAYSSPATSRATPEIASAIPRLKLTRLGHINTIRERLVVDCAWSRTNAALEVQFARSGGAHEFVMADPGSFRVDSDKWLETVSRADFFLCPPGLRDAHVPQRRRGHGGREPFLIINYPNGSNPRSSTWNVHRFRRSRRSDRQASADSRKWVTIGVSGDASAASSTITRSISPRSRSSRRWKGIELAELRVLIVTDANTAQ